VFSKPVPFPVGVHIIRRSNSGIYVVNIVMMYSISGIKYDFTNKSIKKGKLVSARANVNYCPKLNCPVIYKYILAINSPHNVFPS